MRYSKQDIKDAQDADTPQEAAEVLGLTYDSYHDESRWEIVEKAFQALEVAVSDDISAYDEGDLDDVLDTVLSDEWQESTAEAKREAGLKKWSDDELFGIRLPGGIIAIHIRKDYSDTGGAVKTEEVLLNVEIPERKYA